MFFTISKITAFLLNPLTWIVILFVAALFVKNARRKKRVSIAGVVCLIMFTNPAIIDNLLRTWEEPYQLMDKKASYRAGIVLGGGMVTIDQKHDRLIFHENTDRFLQGLHLYENGQIQKIILSGGAGNLVFRQFLEASLIKRYLLEIGVPAEDILIDSSSDNTHQNAVNVAKIINEQGRGGDYLLITSSLHMKRAKACFAKQGIITTAYPTNKMVGPHRTDVGYYLIPSAGALVRWEKFLHELLGYIVYAIMGYI